MNSNNLDNKHSYILARKFQVNYYPTRHLFQIEVRGIINKADLTSLFTQLMRHIKVKSKLTNLIMDFSQSSANINQRELKELNKSILKLIKFFQINRIALIYATPLGIAMAGLVEQEISIHTNAKLKIFEEYQNASKWLDVETEISLNKKLMLTDGYEQKI